MCLGHYFINSSRIKIWINLFNNFKPICKEIYILVELALPITEAPLYRPCIVYIIDLSTVYNIISFIILKYCCHCSTQT